MPQQEALHSRAQQRDEDVRVTRQSERLWSRMQSSHADAAGEARTSLHDLLASFGVDPRRHDGLLEQLLAGAHRRQRDQPHIGLGDCAMSYAEQRFEAWLGIVLEPEIASGQPALTAGRAAFLACGAPTAWPHLILVHDNLPDAFVNAMRDAVPALSPLPSPATMTAQALESWSLRDAAPAALQLLGSTLAWAANSRPLVTASAKLTKPWS